MNSSELNGVYKALRERAVAGRVMNMAGEVLRDAVVQVSPLQAGDYRMFKTDASGDFETFYTLSPTLAESFKVWLTVKKSGFQTAHELVNYADFPTQVRLPITLRPDEQDPNLLSQTELTAHLLAELKSLNSSDELSPKSDKEYEKGLQQFEDKNRPDRALDSFNSVVKDDPQCEKCRTMLALAELDSGNWDGAARDANSAAQATIKSKNQPGGSVPALLLAGAMESWLHDPEMAGNFFAWAEKLGSKDPLVLQEIGRAQLQLGKYDMADAYLQRALAGGAGPEARLLHVQALLGADNLIEANEEMNRYLNGRSPRTMPVEVRRIWAMVQNQEQIEKVYGGPRKPRRERAGAVSVNYLDYSAHELQGLEPAKNQDPLKPILAAVGKNVAELFHDFQSSTSVEQIRQEQLRKNGKVSGSVLEKFHYLCLMPSDAAVPGFTEYRQNVNSDEGMPGGLEEGFMLTSGFASAALIFHPDFQSGSEFRFLGRQMVDSRETDVIAFAQIPTKAELMGRFKSGNKSAFTFRQGLAWIDAQNDQIVRLRTDLLRPLPEVRLTEERTQIDYQEIHFHKISRDFWLPKTVTVTVVWDGKELRNEHQYSDFRLFSVNSSETIRNPKKLDAASDDASARTRNQK